MRRDHRQAELGVSPDAADGAGVTPLMIAQADRLDIVELLLRLGANPVLRNAAGRTAAEEARSQAESWRRNRGRGLGRRRAEGAERKAAFLDESVRR